MQTFAEIWERDGRWLLGPGLLGDVIEHLRGRAPIVVASEQDPSTANMTLPLPNVRDEASGDPRSIYFAVPPELRDLFAERCSLIVRDWYGPEVDRALGQYVGRHQMRQHTLDRINGELRNIERAREARGEDAELWQLAATRFGFSRWALPKPAGLAAE